MTAKECIKESKNLVLKNFSNLNIYLIPDFLYNHLIKSFPDKKEDTKWVYMQLQAVQAESEQQLLNYLEKMVMKSSILI